LARPAVTVTTRDASSTGEHLFLLVVGDGVLATEALPARGSVVIGRAPECDVRIDHGSISRTHATLHLDEPLHIVDANSANGTWVNDQRVPGGTQIPIRLNEAVRLGQVTVIVQRRSAPIRSHRMRSHDYFEERLEDEAARAPRHPDLHFVVAHVALAEPADIQSVLASALRDGDIVASYAPGELEILLLDAQPDEARQVLYRLETTLQERGIEARVGAAWFPRDGRDASGLLARARARALGHVAEPPEGPDIVVADERMKALHQLVVRVAAADISVLLQGETGVGKEVIAELIHRHSSRSKAPFLRLNCAALTETLLESELFGYEKGAFTGAVASKPGLLEVAEGGVVFLDEVGELLPSTQAKLLRVLDDRKVLRVGGLTPRPIDVRIVSATNRDLEAEVQRGAFRLDLLYRLNAMSIIIPPLRERPAEIALLAHRFAAELSAKLGRRVPKFTENAIALLRGYSWPGNVRELRNAIERALILSARDAIDVSDLPVDKMRATFATAPVATGVTQPPPITAAREEADERRRVLEALETWAGHLTHAARLLGISRRTLINKLEKFALPRPRKR
jgi:DNA-binding NtrC family response regulator/pSer/pThr/pTyr-binding forkhead associated (FHA) protein